MAGAGAGSQDSQGRALWRLGMAIGDATGHLGAERATCSRPPSRHQAAPARRADRLALLGCDARAGHRRLLDGPRRHDRRAPRGRAAPRLRTDTDQRRRSGRGRNLADVRERPAPARPHRRRPLAAATPSLDGRGLGCSTGSSTSRRRDDGAFVAGRQQWWWRAGRRPQPLRPAAHRGHPDDPRLRCRATPSPATSSTVEAAKTRLRVVPGPQRRRVFRSPTRGRRLPRRPASPTA